MLNCTSIPASEKQRLEDQDSEVKLSYTETLLSQNKIKQEGKEGRRHKWPNLAYELLAWCWTSLLRKVTHEKST